MYRLREKEIYFLKVKEKSKNQYKKIFLIRFKIKNERKDASKDAEVLKWDFLQKYSERIVSTS